MAYTRTELSGPLQFGDDKKVYFYDGSDTTTSDTLATIAAVGYFNNADDDLRLAVNDLIFVRGNDGFGVFEVVTVSTTGAGVTTAPVHGDASPVETGSTSVSLSAFGTSILSVAAGGQRIYRLPAPTRAGQKKTLLATTSTVHNVQSTGGYTFGTTGATSVNITGLASADARGVELLAASTTQYLISAFVETSTYGQITTS